MRQLRRIVRRLADAWRNIAVFGWSHPWARHDRLGTFTRIVSWQIRSLDGEAHTVDWISGSRLILRRGMHGATGCHYYGFLEFADMAFIGHLLREGDAFADVGANVGVYSVLAGRVCGARVHVFEPAQETLPALRTNLAANGLVGAVVVHAVALSDREGEACFTRGLDAVNRFAAQDECDSVPVATACADTLLADCGIVAIKVDVEGAEELVFAGAARLLAEPQLRVLLVETVGADLEAMFLEAGFKEHFYEPFSRTLSQVPFWNGAKNRLFLRDAAFVAERVRAAPPLRYRRLSV